MAATSDCTVQIQSHGSLAGMVTFPKLQYLNSASNTVFTHYIITLFISEFTKSKSIIEPVKIDSMPYTVEPCHKMSFAFCTNDHLQSITI
jgi:hypothetical protein